MGNDRKVMTAVATSLIQNTPGTSMSLSKGIHGFRRFWIRLVAMAVKTDTKLGLLILIFGPLVLSKLWCLYTSGNPENINQEPVNENKEYVFLRAAYNEMLNESVKYLTTEIPDNQRSASTNNLIQQLESFKNILPEIVFSKSYQSSAVGWVNDNIRKIHLNVDLKSKLMSDREYLKETLLHETIHLAGFYHGAKTPELAYPIAILIFQRHTLTPMLQNAAKDMIAFEPNTKKYIDAFVRYFKVKNFAFSCTHEHHTNTHTSPHINQLQQKADATAEFVKMHLKAIDTLYARQTLEQWQFKPISSNSSTRFTFGVGALQEGSKHLTQIKGMPSNVHGFN